jgi:hypothetical protein
MGGLKGARPLNGDRLPPDEAEKDGVGFFQIMEAKI